MKIPVIGLAGGVGSGKSTVARVLAGVGCVVSDSDAEAKACLREPAVRDLLVARWGAGVLDENGFIDRSAVAKIVFGDDSERAWLESVIHPRLEGKRRAAFERAAEDGAAGFVIDAPLLFEAGLDAGCDAVIFVDCPRSERLRRVRSARGWDEGELDRREKAQMPLEEKRRRSDYVVLNAGDPDDLEAGVREAFEQIRHGSEPC